MENHFTRELNSFRKNLLENQSEDNQFKQSTGIYGYKLLSASGEPSLTNKIYRTKILDENDNYICRALDAPIQRKYDCVENELNDLETLTILDYPFNATQINIVALKNLEGEIEPIIMTNQNINAYRSKFTSPLFENNYKLETTSMGNLFENILTLKDPTFFQKYLKEFKELKQGCIDTWWICEESRTSRPFSEGHTIQYAYSINENGFLHFRLPLTNRKQNTLEMLKQEIEPSSLLILKKTDQNLGNVNNIVSLKVVNEKYLQIIQALNNDPNFFRRIITCIRIFYSNEEQIKDFYENLKKEKGDLIRIENKNRDLILEELKILINYNPTWAFLTLYLFNRLIDRLSFNFFHEYLLKKKNFYFPAFNRILHLEKNKKSNHYLTRTDIITILLLNFSPTYLCEFLFKEIQEIHTVYETKVKNSLQAKYFLIYYSNIQVIQKLFKINDPLQFNLWIKDTEQLDEFTNLDTLSTFFYESIKFFNQELK